MPVRMFRNTLIALGLSALLIACAGEDETSTGIQPSGLAAELYLDEMSVDEKTTFCEWTAEVFGGAGTVYECEAEQADGEDAASLALEPFAIPSVADCTTSGQFTGHCLLGDAEACFIATGGDACKIAAEPACDAINACLSGDTGDNPPANDCSKTRLDCYCLKDDYLDGGERLGSIYLDSCWSWFICSPANCGTYDHNACNHSGLCSNCPAGYCVYGGVFALTLW